eukprot:m.7607 g.7607  ORF g.7607 m.7607 type:complete len:797 (+) comp5264_c0_seq1:335-2725(+)
MEPPDKVALTQAAVSSICESVGYSHARTRACQELALHTQQFIRSIGRAAQQHANDEGRCQGNLDDVGFALRMAGMSRDDLESYLFKRQRPKRRPKLKWPQQKVILDSLENQKRKHDFATRPLPDHIPGYLPRFPVMVDTPTVVEDDEREKNQQEGVNEAKVCEEGSQGSGIAVESQPVEGTSESKSDGNGGRAGGSAEEAPQMDTSSDSESQQKQSNLNGAKVQAIATGKSHVADEHGGATLSIDPSNQRERVSTAIANGTETTADGEDDGLDQGDDEDEPPAFDSIVIQAKKLTPMYIEMIAPSHHSSSAQTKRSQRVSTSTQQRSSQKPTKPPTTKPTAGSGSQESAAVRKPSSATSQPSGATPASSSQPNTPRGSKPKPSTTPTAVPKPKPKPTPTPKSTPTPKPTPTPTPKPTPMPTPMPTPKAAPESTNTSTPVASNGSTPTTPKLSLTLKVPILPEKHVAPSEPTVKQPVVQPMATPAKPASTGISSSSTKPSSKSQPTQKVGSTTNSAKRTASSTQAADTPAVKQPKATVSQASKGTASSTTKPAPRRSSTASTAARPATQTVSTAAKRASSKSRASTSSTSGSPSGAAASSESRKPKQFRIPSMTELVQFATKEAAKLTDVGPPFCVCKSMNTDDPYKQCDGCHGWFHLACVKVPPKFFFAPIWFCPECDARHKTPDPAKLHFFLNLAREYEIRDTTSNSTFKADVVFGKPVDVPNYPDIIDEPCDFSTISKRIDRKFYTKLSLFLKDLSLIVLNCRLYNGESSVYYTYADALGVGLESIMWWYLKKL